MRNSHHFSRVFFAFSLLTCCLFAADQPKPDVYDDPAKVDADYAFQGEYSGEVGEDKVKYGLQVIALGSGKFHAAGLPGGLPGDGWTQPVKLEVDAELNGGVLEFGNSEGKAILKGDGVAQVFDGSGNHVGEFKRITRESPTLGAKPPTGALVLFDGKSADHFIGGQVTPDGLLKEGVTSKMPHGSCQLHLEFRLPYMPKATGQGRGNSGCYLQGRYEVQILDSFGLEGKNNECGGIYTIADPSQNMCFPPLVWQTYDIDYTAATYDAAAKKTKSARITVKHNGVVVQNNVELPNATRGAPVKEGPEPGPLYLQDHGNPVRFRNIWLVAK